MKKIVVISIPALFMVETWSDRSRSRAFIADCFILPCVFLACASSRSALGSPDFVRMCFSPELATANKFKSVYQPDASRESLRWLESLIQFKSCPNPIWRKITKCSQTTLYASELQCEPPKEKQHSRSKIKFNFTNFSLPISCAFCRVLAEL